MNSSTFDLNLFDRRKFTDDGPPSVNDQLARRVERVWKKAFPSASVFPELGVPSKNGGVLLLTHGMDGMPPMKINGLVMKSPLANNALYSAEVTGGKYMNLYEIMIPDIPGRHGDLSTAQVYIKALQDLNLEVNGTHFHWNGATVFPNDKNATAVHHSKADMHPMEFTIRTIMALEKAHAALVARTH